MKYTYIPLIIALISTSCGQKNSGGDASAVKEPSVENEQAHVMVPSATSKAFDAFLTEELDATRLRGFGEISARSYTFPKHEASLLEIQCEDDAHAQLTQAKYLSDLALLPGVELKTIDMAGTAVTVNQVVGQGEIAALQVGAKVYVLASKQADGLSWLLSEHLKYISDDYASTATVEVPMWLDRWDRFGFRHYYRPWERPPNHPREEAYNYLSEFEFAEDNERSGIIFWTKGDEMDTAEGLSNRAWWDWAFEEAAAHQLPVGVNIMTGGAGRSWFFNRYREESGTKMPQFCGTYHTIANPYFGGSGHLSWCAQDAKDMELGLLQEMVEKAVESPNVTTVLEPHGELRHGPHDVFMEYGPLADASYRQFLQQRYDSIEAVNEAQGMDYQSWESLRLPEVASFLGWGSDALDLTGEWRIQYEEIAESADFDEQGTDKYSSLASKGAPGEWFSVDYNDSAWPIVQAPGHDRTMFLKQQPAIYRREFEVSSEFLAQGEGAWLYLWDLNAATGDTVRVVVNGKLVGEDVLPHAVPHWGAYDLSQILKPGKNQISVRLPKGILAYRVYLSNDAPREYPNLGEAKNAQWVDFSDWMTDSRLDMVRRGMEMIRQAAPDQQIMLMAPDAYADGIRKMAVNYGGNFHNTGYMGAFWADLLPALMRGTRLPFSLEPGSPARDLVEFKQHLGRYSTQGLQGIDYFIHLGSIFWNPEIRNHFEENLPLVKLIGKYHAPKADVAALYSTRGNALTGYPWGEDSSTNLSAGYWPWNVRANLQGIYESDGLTESSFEDGDADRYRVVIDTNTSIMDPEMVDDIREYVEQGGVFVCFVQTGRHTTTVKDAWPISELTGFEVTHIDPLSKNGAPAQTRLMHAAPDQDVFKGNWSSVRANGLSLKAVAADAKPLMLWQDDSVAIGMRRIGEGVIIQVGCKFTGKRIMDRYEPGHADTNPRYPADYRALRKLFSQILEWQDIPKVAAELTPQNPNVIWRHYLSNNGLYDVWSLWNQSRGVEVNEALAFDTGNPTDWAFNVLTGERITLQDMQIPVALEPLETAVYLTPRNRIVEAPLEWFKLQRNWWRKPIDFEPTVLPDAEHRFSLDLNDDWAFKTLDASEEGAQFAGIEVDDSSWERVRMGMRPMPEPDSESRSIYRRQFTVPTEWQEADIGLWMMAWIPPTFFDYARVWIDGKLIYGWGRDGITGLNPDGMLKPGKTYTIAVEFKSKGYLAGTRGNTWLWAWPKPSASQDLAGQWTPSSDLLHYGSPVPIPGAYHAQSLLSQGVEISEAHQDDNVVLSIDTTGPLTGVLINGTWVRRLHHHIGTRFDLNITPMVKFGEVNEIEVVCMQGLGSGTVKSIKLNYYKPEVYP